jgi:hypothetical protein
VYFLRLLDSITHILPDEPPQTNPPNKVSGFRGQPQETVALTGTRGAIVLAGLREAAIVGVVDGAVGGAGVSAYQYVTVAESPTVSGALNAAVTGATFGAGVGGVIGAASSALNRLRTTVTGCSFIGDTSVLMGDGTDKVISQVETGDQVLTLDPATGEQSIQSVTAVFPHEDQIVTLTLSDGSEVGTTAKHPWWLPGEREFARTDHLVVGDELLTASGALVSVAAVTFTGGDGRVYDLTVSGTHTFYVGDTPTLVHNCEIATGGGTQPLRSSGSTGTSSGTSASQSGAASAPPRFVVTRSGVAIDRAAIPTTISPQTQARHVFGTREYARKGGGYFNSPAEAQQVLDDVHSGAATILGVKSNGDIVVRTPNVTGQNMNVNAPNGKQQATNVFFIKGTSSASVVPYSPNWTP